MSMVKSDILKVKSGTANNRQSAAEIEQRLAVFTTEMEDMRNNFQTLTSEMVSKGLSIKLTQSGEGVCPVRTFFGQRGMGSLDVDVRTFWWKKVGFFEIYGVPAWAGG